MPILKNEIDIIQHERVVMLIGGRRKYDLRL